MRLAIGSLLMVLGFGLAGVASDTRIMGNDGIFPMSDVYGEWKSETGMRVSIVPFCAKPVDDVILVYLRLSDGNGQIIGDGVVTHNIQRKSFRALLYDMEGRRISVFIRAIPMNKKGLRKYKLEMRAKYLDPIADDEGFNDRGIIGLTRENSVPGNSKSGSGTDPVISK